MWIVSLEKISLPGNQENGEPTSIALTIAF